MVQVLVVAVFTMAAAFTCVEFEWITVLRLPGQDMMRARRLQSFAAYACGVSLVLVMILCALAFLLVPSSVKSFGGQRTLVLAVVALLVSLYALLHGILPVVCTCACAHVRAHVLACVLC